MAAADGRELGHARLLSCSPHPSLSHSLSDAESLSLNSTATRRARIDATSFRAFTRSTSFCSIFSTLRSFMPETPRRGTRYERPVAFKSRKCVHLTTPTGDGARKRASLPSRIALSKSFRGSTSGMFGFTGFRSWPSTMLFTGFSFGGLVAIILAMSPFVNGNGAVGPLATGGGGGGGGGGGMLHGGEMGLGGVGSGVGGGGGRS